MGDVGGKIPADAVLLLVPLLQLADLLLLQESRRQAGAGLLVASATTAGASETYLTGAQAARAVEQAAWDILAGALGGDPFGLLYRGI